MFRSLAFREGFMGKLWNREHLETRVDRCYLLAAAAKIPEIRQLHIGRARLYRRMLSSLSATAG